MATPIPSPTALRALRRSLAPQTQHNAHGQVRHATLLRRPKRPYTFTQLITLSDGSTFLHRTTSPVPVHKSTKDTRNTPLWNPSSQKLLNIEEDEAGKLAAFRSKYGRGWDATQGKQTPSKDSFVDLISGQGGEPIKKAASKGKAAVSKAAAEKK